MVEGVPIKLPTKVAALTVPAVVKVVPVPVRKMLAALTVPVVVRVVPLPVRERLLAVGVVRVGLFAKTSDPVPVLSGMMPANWAEVVELKSDNLFAA